MVQETDALLVGGGDPLFLCYWMRQPGLADLLPSLRRETVYVGVSAGSMVMAAAPAATTIAYTIQAVGPAALSGTSWPVIGLTNSGTVILDAGTKGCWVGRTTYIPCSQLTGAGNDLGPANSSGDRILLHPLSKDSQKATVSVARWTGTTVQRTPLRFPKGMVCLIGASGLVLTILSDGDVIGSLIPASQANALNPKTRQYLWKRGRALTYSGPIHLAPPGISDPYLIQDATVAFGHVVLTARTNGPLKVANDHTVPAWIAAHQPSGLRGSPPVSGLEVCPGKRGNST